MSATECEAAIGQIRLKDLQTAVRVWITLQIYNSYKHTPKLMCKQHAKATAYTQTFIME